MCCVARRGQRCGCTLPHAGGRAWRARGRAAQTCLCRGPRGQRASRRRLRTRERGEREEKREKLERVCGERRTQDRTRDAITRRRHPRCQNSMSLIPPPRCHPSRRPAPASQPSTASRTHTHGNMPWALGHKQWEPFLVLGCSNPSATTCYMRTLPASVRVFARALVPPCGEVSVLEADQRRDGRLQACLAEAACTCRMRLLPQLLPFKI